MNQTDDEFVSVGSFEKAWNATQTGSAAKGNRQDLPATKDSWIMGWYMGSRTQQIGTDTHTIHKIKAVAFGDPKHSDPIVDKENGEFREFFGTKVVNEKLATNVQPGQFVRITYMGPQDPKKPGGKKYKGWNVEVSTKRAPISVFGATSAAPPVQNTVGAAQNSAAVDIEEEDELPF